jgi:hypothetical protein
LVSSIESKRIYLREEYESDRIQSEEEETVQEKKIRLAKHFIDQIQQGKQRN